MSAATPGQAAHQAETVAIAFHQAYEELAPQYGYRTREASAKPWDEVPAKNAALMVATAARLLETGVISAAAQEPHAAPGLAALRERLARAEGDRNAARNVVADILDCFSPSGSGHTARVGQVQIAKWRTRAGLTS